MSSKLGFLSRVSVVLVIGLGTCGHALAQGVALSLSSGSASPGGSVTLNIALNASGDLPASTEWTLNYSTTDFTAATFQSGPEDTSKSLSCNSGTGTATCVVWGLNTASIPNNTLASVTLTLAGSTSDTSSSVQLTSGSSADATGTAIPTSVNGGTITILQTPALMGLSCSPTSLTPSAGSACKVSLTSAALSPGASIALSASPAGANVPATGTIPQGSTSATTSVTAGTVSASTPVTLTASYSGGSLTFGLTVNPPAPMLSNVSVSPSAIMSGQSGTGTVNLTAAAGSGGVGV